MVVLSAAITTRSGKAILARQFRQMQRSRVEGLLASFPKLADTSSQHTTVEQDNVRFVYQPLDELYIVLITNRQSNILQDISTLHLFVQVVGSICRSFDEREITRCAFELLTAFDEVVTLGYRENLTMAQIKTFLEMDSHEERIQEIIARNKELEASEERKRKAKQLEMQRKEMARAARAGGGGIGMPRTPNYPTYAPTTTTPTVAADSYDSYAAAKKPMPIRAKGMQLGKKKTTNSMFEQVRQDLGPEEEAGAPLAGVPARKTASAVQPSLPASKKQPTHEGVHVTIEETIACKLSREGAVETFESKGELQLSIANQSLSQIKLELRVGDTHGAPLTVHPKINKTQFKNLQILQLADTSKGFPVKGGTIALRWKLAAKPDDVGEPPLKFTVWPSQSDDGWSITVEYELTDVSVPLKDVAVAIPYGDSEPTVSSFDAVYQVMGDSLEWQIGDVDGNNSSGSFEFEASAPSDEVFFPMQISFTRAKPWVDVDVATVRLVQEDQEIDFTKDLRSVAEGYEVVH
ncbi:hypothetical protein K470DRAFT_264654 [Piedraia hortae CBS 480.64]|uniref:Coatomer subunit delta n=1 Tax=Piedraia hortae CBS 480.64 TaxID=1314780 RepID=A0A6A7BXT4_9PEZI|nr:hypothetical protein K470DRAFT_264654 [Piedraia hortae CBS 480.64]